MKINEQERMTQNQFNQQQLNISPNMNNKSVVSNLYSMGSPNGKNINSVAMAAAQINFTNQTQRGQSTQQIQQNTGYDTRQRFSPYSPRGLESYSAIAGSASLEGDNNNR